MVVVVVQLEDLLVVTMIVVVAIIMMIVVVAIIMMIIVVFIIMMIVVVALGDVAKDLALQTTKLEGFCRTHGHNSRCQVGFG